MPQHDKLKWTSQRTNISANRNIKSEENLESRQRLIDIFSECVYVKDGQK